MINPLEGSVSLAQRCFSYPLGLPFCSLGKIEPGFLILEMTTVIPNRVSIHISVFYMDYSVNSHSDPVKRLFCILQKRTLGNLRGPFPDSHV